MLYRLRHFNWKLAVIFGLGCTLITYLLLIKPYFNEVTFKIYIETDHGGVMELFPPIKGIGYSQAHARAIYYPRNKSGHIVTIYYSNPKKALRFDPTVTKGNVLISKMIVGHFGVEKVLVGQQFETHIARCEQANCTVSSNGLLLEASDVDSKVFFKPSIVPWFSPSLPAAILSLAFLAGTILSRGVGTGNTTQVIRVANIKIVTRILLVFLVLHYLAIWISPFLGSVVNAIGLTLLLAWGGRLLIRNTMTSLEHADAYIIVFSTALVVIAIFSMSFTSGFFEALDATIASNDIEEASNKEALLQTRSDIEQSYIKHFFAKDAYINLDAKAKIFGLGFTPNAKSILGREGWYFEGYGSRRVEQDIVKSYDNITDYMGLLPFSEEELQQWKEVLEERYYWMKEQGIDYVFAIAPTKALVYPEKMPMRLFELKKELNQQTRYEQLVHFLSENSIVPMVDLRTSLYESRNDYQWPLYYRTDFHWNYLGSFLAYQAIVKELNLNFPKHQLQAQNLDDFRIDANYEWSHHTFLRLAGLNPEEHKDDTYLTLYPNNTDHYANDNKIFKQGIYDGTIPAVSSDINDANLKTNIRKIKNEKGRLESIFVIGDSFAEKLVGYFSAHAKTVYNYRTVSHFVLEPIEQYKPQIVVQELLSMYLLDKPPVNPPEIRKPPSGSSNP